jgi:recombination protein RecT
MSNAVQKQAEPGQTVRQLIVSQQKALTMALPKHIQTDRFLRMCLTVISKNKKLQECDSISLLGAFIQCAQLGLEPSDGMGEAYIIPYKTTATFIPGYLGLMKLVRNSGHIKTFSKGIVYEGDKFTYEMGLRPKLKHTPSDGERGEMTHVYAAAILQSGQAEFEVMNRVQIEGHRDRYSKKPKWGPWVWEEHFEAMALKTVIRKLCKFLPKSAELNQALLLDSKQEVLEDQRMHQVALEAGIKPPEGWEEPKVNETIEEILKDPKPEDHENTTTTAEEDAQIEVESKAHDKSLNDFAGMKEAVQKQGGDVGKILNMKDPDKVMTFQKTQIDAATAVLVDWSQKKLAEQSQSPAK